MQITIISQLTAVSLGSKSLVCCAQKWLQRTLCVALFMALFAGLFQQSVNRTGDPDLIDAYWIIIKTAGCILLACSANVLKTLAAKLMSNHFYRDSYFDKMQDALCKVSCHGKQGLGEGGPKTTKNVNVWKGAHLYAIMTTGSDLCGDLWRRSISWWP